MPTFRSIARYAYIIYYSKYHFALLAITMSCASKSIITTRPFLLFKMVAKLMGVVVLATPPLKFLIPVINVILLLFSPLNGCYFDYFVLFLCLLFLVLWHLYYSLFLLSLCLYCLISLCLHHPKHSG